MTYVDVIFAHRYDRTGAPFVSRPCPLSENNHPVPMEEIVRAFNFVIEKGWVSCTTATTFVDF
jgi:aryl-alcohol dehydrogenase-like predicted oxidoreductase